MQRKIDIQSVAERIQKLQRLDAAIEHAVTALRVDVFRRIARHRRNDLDFVSCQKPGEMFIAWLEQDRKIAAINHVPWRIERLNPLNKVTKIRDHFGRAA